MAINATIAAISLRGLNEVKAPDKEPPMGALAAVVAAASVTDTTDATLRIALVAVNTAVVGASRDAEDVTEAVAEAVALAEDEAPGATNDAAFPRQAVVELDLTVTSSEYTSSPVASEIASMNDLPEATLIVQLACVELVE